MQNAPSSPLTSPKHVLYPNDAITKQQVFDYYTAVAAPLLEEIRGRLLSVVRCPDGIDGAHFYQKHPGPGFRPAILRRDIVEQQGDTASYFYVDDIAGVLALVQMDAVEFHPWGSHVDHPEHPDRLIFDLDPGPDVAWSRVKSAARQLRDCLDDIGLQSFPRLTGGKGVHIIVPIHPHYPWDNVHHFCRCLAETLATRAPDQYVTTASKSKRHGKIFIDWLRNGRGATAIASWSLRARPHAPIAMPVSWDELARCRRADKFHIQDALKRIATHTRPVKDVPAQELPPLP